MDVNMSIEEEILKVPELCNFNIKYRKQDTIQLSIAFVRPCAIDAWLNSLHGRMIDRYNYLPIHQQILSLKV